MRQIRKATINDLNRVRTWLQQESDDGYDSFIVNFSLIEAGQRNGELTVLLDQGFPVAFALGEDNLSILAVKRDRRNSGIGTELASHWFQKARERDLIGFDGECAPATSVQFWKKMGCTQVRREALNPWVAMPFPHSRELPDNYPIVSLTFELHDLCGHPIPEWNFLTTAAIKPDGYMLAHDFVAYVPDRETRLTIRGNELSISSKCKYIKNIGGESHGLWIRVRNLITQ